MAIDTNWICDQVEHTKDMHIIDVGAFDGNLTRIIADKFPDNLVHSIEADPVNFKYLKSSCNSYNIVCYNLAMNDCDCEVPIYVINHKKYSSAGLTSQSNSIFKNFIASKTKKYTKTMVKGITLDGFCDLEKVSKIGLLKINCEGCEFKIFDSKSLEFLKFTDVISLAMHGKEAIFVSNKYENKKVAINKVLIDHGFKCLAGKPILKKRPKDARRDHILQVWKKMT